MRQREAEYTNKTIIQNLKKKLESAKGKWRETLPEVLWAYWTTPKSSTEKTPFFLVYGAEALIPVEVGEPISRFWHASEESNHEAMAMALELLDERREASLVRMAAQKQKIERYYNMRTNLRYFEIGDLVLRKASSSRATGMCRCSSGITIRASDHETPREPSSKHCTLFPAIGLLS
uniref:Uncharacterized protein LOC104233682 n=1 Tax=Nicotiana sylvestris TaxID=4096 RepID=A0A1U7X6W4_NICSY|nr:PREDICTED: uncharacterized protein LOC104233682 [Nicotiana sylvestris]